MSAHQGTGSSYTIGNSKFEASQLASGLYLVATPIGNLGDITLRALETLAAADAVYCEDTRVTSKLCARYQIARPLKPYHDHNAAKVRSFIIDHVKAGKAVALVSDAGTPLVSDPGFKLVEECIRNDVKVEMIPGPSAVLHALAVSGIAPDRFLFAGFLPAKQSQRKQVLEELNNVRATLVFFETPHRLTKTLSDIAAVLGPRFLAVGRELTKFHEEVLRGDSEQVLQAFNARPSIRGEMTIVVAPAESEPLPAGDAAILRSINEGLETMSLSRLAATVAKQFGRPRREIYELAMHMKRTRSPSHDKS